MISENLVSLILNYIDFNKSKFLDLRSYNLDYSNNSKITFENFISFIPLAIGINLSYFDYIYKIVDTYQIFEYKFM